MTSDLVFSIQLTDFPFIWFRKIEHIFCVLPYGRGKLLCTVTNGSDVWQIEINLQSMNEHVGKYY